MHLDQLRTYAKVVQSGSFTRAAELLGTRKSQVSRVISQLEASLGVKLLERTTRALSVTEIGREVHERALGILAAVDDTERVAQAALAEPRGLLRLTCGVEFGMLAVNAWVERFLRDCPLAQVEVEYTSRVIDLVHEGFDLAIRVGTPEESRLVARRLGEIRYRLYASAAYLARLGNPVSPQALSGHELLMFNAGSHRAAWTLRQAANEVRVQGSARLRVNNAFAVRDATLAGLGIGKLPTMIADPLQRAGQLQQVLPDWESAPVPVHALYPSHRYLTPKVRAFIDIACQNFPG